jgi:hypothetical protein
MEKPIAPTIAARGFALLGGQSLSNQGISNHGRQTVIAQRSASGNLERLPDSRFARSELTQSPYQRKQRVLWSKYITDLHHSNKTDGMYEICSFQS